MADMTIHVFHHFDGSWMTEAPPWAVELKATLDSLKTQETNQMATIQELVAETSRTKTVVESVKVAFDGLKAKVTELTTALEAAMAANDPVAMQTAVDDLKAVNAALDALAPAVIENTPPA
jgi:predicted  nucleic acid-binding Zn-ribbon protein